jgi:methylglyoxal synthase
MALMPDRKVIALVAHDGKPKQEICKLINYGNNKEVLKNFRLVGTSSTATLIQETCGLEVEALGHGPDGGDIVMAYELLQGDLDYLIFFINVTTPQAHEVDIQMLIRAAVLHNVPLALNRATADQIIQAIAK